MDDFSNHRPDGRADSGPARLTRDEINDALNAAAASALAHIMPAGYLDGREFRCGDVFGTAPSRKTGGSFWFNVDKLTGADWSPDTGAIKDTYGSVLDVYVVNHRGDFKAACATALEFLGRSEDDRPAPRIEKASRNKSRITTWIEGTPPADAPAPNFQSLWKGKFRQVWAYRDHTGNLLFYVARYEDRDGRKATPVVSWGHSGDGVWHWRAKGVGQHILFGLELLAAYPVDTEIWIFEGEKTATKARELFPNVICLAWKGGAANIKNIDMSPLVGRRIRFIPDADKNGVSQKQMAIGATKANAVGAATVAVVVIPEAFADFKDGWDVADRLPRGWTVGTIRALIEMTPWQGPPPPPPPRGTKAGIAPYWQSNPRPVSEVRTLLESKTREDGNIAIKTTPGTGKTTAEIKRTISEQGWIIFAEPNHQIALQVVEDMQGFGLHLAGRNYDDMCEIPEDAENAHAAGLNVREELCRFCPHETGCRYLGQLDRIKQAMNTRPAGAIVTVHPFYAQSMAREIDSDKIVRIVIDEKIDLDRDTRIPLDRLDKDCSDTILGQQVMDAFNDAGFLPLSSFNADELEHRAGIEGKHVRLKLDPEMSFEDRRATIRHHAANRKADFRWRFQLLFSTMAQEIRDGRVTSNQIVLVRDEKVGKTEPRNYIHVYGKKKVADKLTGVQVHYIDGTMDRLHARALLGNECSYIALDAERKLTVTQVCDAVFSKNHLLFSDGAEDNRKKVYRFVMALGKWHQKILIGVPKKVRDVMETEWRVFAENAENVPVVEWIHHNKGRGENKYADFDCAVVVGREEPGIRTIEALARMRFPETPITPLPMNVTEWPKRFQGYTMKDGRQIGTEVSYHPDPLCQSVLEQIREGEIVQIADRLRGVNRTTPPSVYILTNIPVEIPVDRLIPWRDLLKEVAGDHDGTRHWWQEALKIGGGVAPLKADWLVAAGIFSKKSAAKQAVTRLVSIRRHHTNDNSISVMSPYPTLIEFRLQNQRHGRNSLALVAPGTSDAAEILARHVGKLSKFNDEVVVDMEQEEPGAFEPESHELVELAEVDDTPLPEVVIPSALVDARRIIIAGEERGRIDHLGHRIPTSDYCVYDEHYKYRKWSVNDASRFIEFLKLTGAAVEQSQTQRVMERRSWAREILDDTPIISGKDTINGNYFSAMLD